MTAWQQFFISRNTSIRRARCGRASVIACRRRKPWTQTGGSMSAGSTASALMLTRNLWQRRICTTRHPGSTSTSMSNPSVRVKFSLTKKPTASVWSLPSKPFRDMRFWSPRIWTPTTRTAHNASTTTSWSTRSASKTAERFTLPRIPYRSCGKSATTSAATTGCRFCHRPDGATEKASVRGSTAPRRRGTGGNFSSSTILTPP